ncbi:MAG TPA: tripartite tricarboxylate transporter substrate-binding protein [Alphaproteobacteria bacterium]|nr:tripartite tricarboxylate transporter substrate-binding protein [Alphaproteobacteria bacterium]
MTPRLTHARILVALLTGASALAVAASASAQSIESVYKGKQIKLISSSDAGGGYDASARLLARHMGNFIAGNPQIIVQNMPGAGGIKAANYLYNVAPKDGLTIGGVHRTVPQAPMLGLPGTQFDAAKFSWLGSMNNEVSVCVAWHTAPVKTMEDALKMEMIVGGSGQNDTEQFPAVLNNIVGTKFKIISGYPSGTAVDLAMERGEVQSRCGWSWSSVMTQHPDWVRDKKINILVQISSAKHPDLPNVRLIDEFAKTQEDKDVLDFLFARQVFGRPFVIPPGVATERVNALRTAFDDAVKSPALIADAEKQKQELTPVSGLEVQALIEKLLKASPAVVARADKATEYHGPVSKAVAKVETPKGTIAELKDDAREVVLKQADGKMFNAKVSGSRTTITVAGKEGDRKALKAGMACEITAVASGEEASKIACQ